MNNNIRRSRLIGEILVEKEIISQDQLIFGLKLQEDQGGFICSVIIKNKLASIESVYNALAQHIGVEFADLKKIEVEGKALARVPAKIALHYHFLPFNFKDNKLKVAIADPLDVHKLDDLALLLDLTVEPWLSYEEEILEGLKKHYGLGASILEGMMAQSKDSHDHKSKESIAQDLEGAAEQASMIKFVNEILARAIEERATDIHFEPFENESRVRFRIDGFLYEVPIPESIKVFHNSIVSRIKVMSGLDIAEHRLSQDGRIKIKVKDEELDLRVSILPSSYGETLQIRILSRQSFLNIDNLGLSELDKQTVSDFLKKPHGIIFVTGPTGSGKSTTLYACLSQKNLPDNKIVTIEDPIEYQLRGITQIQVNPKIDFTFAQGLRSILRHDPDIIMVGEVRDSDTAEITIRSAMTGHLVFSTLHTNDAYSAPTRLIDMGIEPFLVASSLEGIIAQRLVRTICLKCKFSKTIDADIFRANKVCQEAQVNVFEGKGCEFCRFTGYKGRTAIFEILSVSDEIRDLIYKKVTSHIIKEQALKTGMLTLRQDGLKKVLNGLTTLSEVMRVT